MTDDHASSAISGSTNRSPIETLESQNIDLETLGPNLLTPFRVRRYKKARLLWLNERWLLENGVNVYNDATREEVCDWLLETYAVGARAANQPSQQFTGKSGLMQADRYGGSVGTPQGGSGRCGIRGRFNAKGIGRTPLVSDYVDDGHKNGFMPLSEALTEAVFSEITDFETPYGSIPTLAILSTGHRYAFSPERGPEPCAVVVRPNFVRPAHFERSIFFGDSGSKTSAQYLDALRVREAVQTVHGARRKVDLPFQSPEDMFLRFATQVGACRANRLWQGQFLSSNMSMCGAFVDFGAFRSVYSWQQAIGLSSQVFGKEAASIRAAYKSIKFYFDKYSAGVSLRSKGFFDAFEKKMDDQIRTAFKQSCAEGFLLYDANSPKTSRNYAKLMWEYQAYQQQTIYRIGITEHWSMRRPWALHAFKANSVHRNSGGQAKKYLYHDAEAKFAKEITREVEMRARQVDVAPELAVTTLKNWMQPRPHLFHEVIMQRAKQFCARMKFGAEGNPQKVKTFIDFAIARNRRYWPQRPRYFGMSSQCTDGRSFAVYGCLKTYANPKVWVHGHVFGGKATLFEQALNLADLKHVGADITGHKFRALVDFRTLENSAEIQLGETRIKLPAPMFKYLA